MHPNAQNVSYTAHTDLSRSGLQCNPVHMCSCRSLRRRYTLLDSNTGYSGIRQYLVNTLEMPSSLSAMLDNFLINTTLQNTLQIHTLYFKHMYNL